MNLFLRYLNPSIFRLYIREARLEVTIDNLLFFHTEVLMCPYWHHKQAFETMNILKRLFYQKAILIIDLHIWLKMV